MRIPVASLFRGGVSNKLLSLFNSRCMKVAAHNSVVPELGHGRCHAQWEARLLAGVAVHSGPEGDKADLGSWRHGCEHGQDDVLVLLHRMVRTGGGDAEEHRRNRFHSFTGELSRITLEVAEMIKLNSGGSGKEGGSISDVRKGPGCQNS